MDPIPKRTLIRSLRSHPEEKYGLGLPDPPPKEKSCLGPPDPTPKKIQGRRDKVKEQTTKVDLDLRWSTFQGRDLKVVPTTTTTTFTVL